NVSVCWKTSIVRKIGNAGARISPSANGVPCGKITQRMEAAGLIFRTIMQEAGFTGGVKTDSSDSPTEKAGLHSQSRSGTARTRFSKSASSDFPTTKAIMEKT